MVRSLRQLVGGEGGLAAKAIGVHSRCGQSSFQRYTESTYTSLPHTKNNCTRTQPIIGNYHTSVVEVK